MSGFKGDSTRFLKLIFEVQLQKEMNAQRRKERICSLGRRGQYIKPNRKEKVLFEKLLLTTLS